MGLWTAVKDEVATVEGKAIQSIDVLFTDIKLVIAKFEAYIKGQEKMAADHLAQVSFHQTQAVLAQSLADNAKTVLSGLTQTLPDPPATSGSLNTSGTNTVPAVTALSNSAGVTLTTVEVPAPVNAVAGVSENAQL